MSSDKDASATVMGIKLAAGLALEEAFDAGVRRETIRSLFQVVNSLDFSVQVCTARVGAAASTSRAAPQGADQLAAASVRGAMRSSDLEVPSVPEVAEDEVFENERYMPLKGFGHKLLLPVDPHRYAARLAALLR